MSSASQLDQLRLAMGRDLSVDTASDHPDRAKVTTTNVTFSDGTTTALLNRKNMTETRVHGNKYLTILPRYVDIVSVDYAGMY